MAITIVLFYARAGRALPADTAGDLFSPPYGLSVGSLRLDGDARLAIRVAAIDVYEDYKLEVRAEHRLVSNAYGTAASNVFILPKRGTLEIANTEEVNLYAPNGELFVLKKEPQVLKEEKTDPSPSYVTYRHRQPNVIARLDDTLSGELAIDRFRYTFTNGLLTEARLASGKRILFKTIGGEDFELCDGYGSPVVVVQYANGVTYSMPKARKACVTHQNSNGQTVDLSFGNRLVKFDYDSGGLITSIQDGNRSSTLKWARTVQGLPPTLPWLKPLHLEALNSEQYNLTVEHNRVTISKTTDVGIFTGFTVVYRYGSIVSIKQF